MNYDADAASSHDEIAVIAAYTASLRVLHAPAPAGVRDIMVTVPMGLWPRWLAEGGLPGDPPEESGHWDFAVGPTMPMPLKVGARVYVVAHGMLRGYALLVGTSDRDDGRRGGCLVRGGGAVACTIRGRWIHGFRGWRHADFPREALSSFPEWAVAGVPRAQKKIVDRILCEREKGPVEHAELRRRALAGLPLFG